MQSNPLTFSWYRLPTLLLYTTPYKTIIMISCLKCLSIISLSKHCICIYSLDSSSLHCGSELAAYMQCCNTRQSWTHALCIAICLYAELWYDASAVVLRTFNYVSILLQQWRDSRGQGGRVPPCHFSPGNFCWPTTKREARKKGKMEKKRKKNQKKGKWKIENGRGKSDKMRRRPWGPFFFPSSSFFFFLLTFQNHWNLFWVYQNGYFLHGKSISRREKI